MQVPTGPTTSVAASGDGPKATPVEIRNGNVQPWRTFEEVDFVRQLKDPLLAAGFAAPTLIQQYSWPVLRSGRDAIGIAKTGSGKTISFLMPAFSILLEKPPRSQHPSLLVMAPTRELIVQIAEESKKFGDGAGIRTVAVYGGQQKGIQLGELRKMPHCIAGTPGRLNDFLEMGAINVGEISFLTLDEADRMLDMGFEPQIRKVLNYVPRQRQTMMFSATWPNSVMRLAREFLNNPVEIRIGNQDALQAPAWLEGGSDDTDADDDDDDGAPPTKRRRCATSNFHDVSKVKEAFVELCKPKVAADLATLPAGFKVDAAVGYEQRFPTGYLAMRFAVPFETISHLSADLFPDQPVAGKPQTFTRREAVAHMLRGDAAYFIADLPPASDFAKRTSRFWTRPDRAGHHAGAARKTMNAMVRDLKVEVMQFVVNESLHSRVSNLESDLADQFDDLLSILSPEQTGLFKQAQERRRSTTMPNPQGGS